MDAITEAMNGFVRQGMIAGAATLVWRDGVVHAAGAGLRYRTPLGPVRVEIAWKLWGFDAQDRKGRPLIFLTIGHIF